MRHLNCPHQVDDQHYLIAGYSFHWSTWLVNTPLRLSYLWLPFDLQPTGIRSEGAERQRNWLSSYLYVCSALWPVMTIFQTVLPNFAVSSPFLNSSEVSRISVQPCFNQINQQRVAARSQFKNQMPSGIENCHLQLISLLKIVIFHTYVNVYQRVSSSMTIDFFGGEIVAIEKSLSLGG